MLLQGPEQQGQGIQGQEAEAACVRGQAEEKEEVNVFVESHSQSAEANKRHVGVIPLN